MSPLKTISRLTKSLEVFEFNVFLIEFSLIQRQELTLDDGFLMMRQSYTAQNEAFYDLIKQIKCVSILNGRLFSLQL